MSCEPVERPDPHVGRPPHPVYGAPLSGRPTIIDGITFRPYRRGILLYAWASDDFRVEVWGYPRRRTLTAMADGAPLPTSFRTLQTAARAAAKALIGSSAPPSPQDTAERQPSPRDEP